MKYAKLINGNIHYGPKNALWNNHTVNNPSVGKLLELGYKPVIYTDPPDDAPEGKHYESGWKETNTEIIQTWHLEEDPVYPEPELTAEEALNIITGGSV